MENEARPANRKHAGTISNNLQIIYPYVALMRMAECDELVFIWKVFGSVILADDLLETTGSSGLEIIEDYTLRRDTILKIPTKF